MSHQRFLENVEEELECGLQLEHSLGLGKVFGFPVLCLKLSLGDIQPSLPSLVAEGALSVLLL